MGRGRLEEVVVEPARKVVGTGLGVDARRKGSDGDADSGDGPPLEAADDGG